MSESITGLIRFIHVLSAVFWIGGAGLFGMLIAPRVLKNGPPAIRRPFAEAVLPALPRYFAIMAILAFGSGILLVGMIWGWANYFDAFQAPTYGPSLTIGVLAAIATAIVGFGIVAPTGKKLIGVMQSINGPPTPAQQETLAALGKKSGMMSMLAVTFGTIAIFAMVWAVNTVR